MPCQGIGAGVVKLVNTREETYARKLSASLETMGVELVKFGETFQLAIPSEALKRERVET